VSLSTRTHPRRPVLFGFLLAAFGGCWWGTPHRDTAQAFAGQQIGCSASNIQLNDHDGTDGWYTASGCGKTTEMYCAMSVVDGDRDFRCRLPPASEEQAALWQVASRMKCEESRVELEPTQARVYAASGCSQRATVTCRDTDAPFPTCR
jgi:hypothetical protein